VGIRYALIDVGATAQPRIRVPGIPTAQNVGWYQFVYGTFAGKLQPINFAQSILIPEAQGPTGGYLFLPPGTAWNLTTADDPPNGISVTTAVGIVNLTLNALGGLTNGVIAPVTQMGTARAIGTEVQYVGSGNLLTAGPNANTVVVADEVNLQTNFGFYMALLSFASEIAQWTCYYNASQTFTEYASQTGANLFPLTPVPCRSLQIIVPSVPSGTNYRFGSTGALMLGHYAWYYDGYYGPLKYINNSTLYAEPEMPTANGVYVMLKPGVQANIIVGTSTYAIEAMATATGYIGLLSGIVSGFTNPF
jgi:hypothetical protein